MADAVPKEGLRSGHAWTQLDARVDDSGFLRFDRLQKKAAATKNVSIKLGATVNAEGFNRFGKLATGAKKNKQHFMKLGAKTEESGFKTFDRLAAKAKKHKQHKMVLGAKFESKDFTRFMTAAKKAAAVKNKTVKLGFSYAGEKKIEQWNAALKRVEDGIRASAKLRFEYDRKELDKFNTIVNGRRQLYRSNPITVKLKFEMDRTQLDLFNALVNSRRDVYRTNPIKVHLGWEIDERQYYRFVAMNQALPGSHTTNLGFGQGGGGRGGSGLMRAARPLAMLGALPTLATGAGLAAQALSGLSAGFMAVTGAAGPATGAVAAFPAGLLTLGGALVTAKLALGGMTEALGGNKKAYERLTPSAKEFYKTVKGYKPELDSLRKAAQEPLFARLELSLRRLKPLWEVGEKAVGAFAVAIGDLALEATAMFTSEGWMGDLETGAKGGASYLTLMGKGLLNLLDALRNVLAAGAPFTRWIFESLHGWTQMAKASAEFGRASGSTLDFFNKSRTAIRDVWQLTESFFSALGNIAGMGTSTGFLHELAETANKWEEWTNSVEGSEAIRAWYKRSEGPMREMARLVRDIFHWIFEAGEGTGLESFIRKIRQMLPGFAEMSKQMMESFGPALGEAIMAIGRIFVELSEDNGPLVRLLKLVADIANGFADFLDNNPAIKELVVSLIVLGAALNLISFLAAITGITKLIMLIRVAVTAMGGMSAIGAFMMGPWGAAILGVIAVMVLLIARWDEVKAVAQWAADGIVTSIGWIAGALSSAWDGIQSLTGAVTGFFEQWAFAQGAMARATWDAVSSAVSDIRSFFGGLARDAESLATKASGAIYRFTKKATDWIANLILAIQGLPRKGIAALTRFASRARSAIGGAMGAARGAVAGALNAIVRTANRMASALSRIPGRVLSAFRSLGSGLKNMLGRTIDGVIRSVTSIPGRIVRAIRSAFSRGGNFALNVVQSIRDWLNNNTIFGDRVDIGPLHFTIPALAQGGFVDESVKGGFYGSRSERGADTSIAAVGRGEAWLNAGQVNDIDGMLQQTRGISIEQYFGGDWKPHTAYARGGLSGQRRAIERMASRRQRLDKDYSNAQREAEVGGINPAEYKRLSGLRETQSVLIRQETNALTRFISDLRTTIREVERELRGVPRGKAGEGRRTRLQEELDTYKEWFETARGSRTELRDGADELRLDRGDEARAQRERDEQQIAVSKVDARLEEIELEMDRAYNDPAKRKSLEAETKQLLLRKKDELEARRKVAQRLGWDVGPITAALRETYQGLAGFENQRESFADQLVAFNAGVIGLMPELSNVALSSPSAPAVAQQAQQQQRPQEIHHHKHWEPQIHGVPQDGSQVVRIGWEHMAALGE